MEHDCGPGGLRSCETHPRVHVVREWKAWSVWKPPKTPDHVVTVASNGFLDHKHAMNYAQELAQLLMRERDA